MIGVFGVSRHLRTKAPRNKIGQGRPDMTEIELKGLAAFDASNADVFYQLGILYSAGGEIPADYGRK